MSCWYAPGIQEVGAAVVLVGVARAISVGRAAAVDVAGQKIAEDVEVSLPRWPESIKLLMKVRRHS